MSRQQPVKRVNGTGSVFQRKDGKWVAAVTHDGRRIVKYAATRREAEARLRALLAEQEARTLTPPTHLTLAVWVEEWLELSSHRLRPISIQTYRSVLAPVLAQLGPLRLDKLTSLRVSQTFADLRQRGRGPRRLALAHATLTACLRRAVELRLISHNPMTAVEPPQWRRREARYWNLGETLTFLRYAAGSRRSRYAPLFVLLCSTGLRLGEATGLTWEHVDLEHRVLRVQRGLSELGGVWHDGDPKTKAGRRTISLPEVAVAALGRRGIC